MTYQECIDYFYSQLPMFHRSGAAALKPSLNNIKMLCDQLGSPERGFKSVHVAGTNGKGSSSHLLAAVLQCAGYKTGLYTSPHLKDFRERIRINGTLISKRAVVEFVTKNYEIFERINPSFFEMTVALAFQYFDREELDIAIIEVGLGGRLDSTNIIAPLVCLITNIAWDHSDLLGDTLELIAGEKAGIIKPGVPVIIGAHSFETDHVFETKAQEMGSPIQFAPDQFQVQAHPGIDAIFDIYESGVIKWKDVEMQLAGPYQALNLPGVFQVLDMLAQKGFNITEEHIREGLKQVTELTGIRGRWQILSHQPTVICDTGHNRAALEGTVNELLRLNKGQIHMIMGFVNDKDIRSMLAILPKNAKYYFCSAKVPRSLAARDLRILARAYDLKGVVIEDPNQALQAARNKACPEDLIFVGGSTYVVAELNEFN